MKTEGGSAIPYVDLGLPSGLLWAQYNIGATSEEERGLYFSWGNVDGHYNDGYNFNATTYNSTPGKTLTGDIPTNATYDAARANLGNGWRMPTTADFDELKNNTTQKFVSDYNGTGVKGWKYISKTGSGNYIFIPLAGFYNGTGLSWYNTYGQYNLASYNGGNVWTILLSTNNSNNNSEPTRERGRTIRAVFNP